MGQSNVISRSSFTVTMQGGQRTIGYYIDGLTPADDPCVEAYFVLGLFYGAPYPFFGGTGMYCTELKFDPYPKDSKTSVMCVATFASPQLSNSQQFKIRINGSTVQEKTDFDPDTGKPLICLYTDPNTGKVYGCTVDATVPKNKCIIEYEHVEPNAPADALQCGYVNSDQWNGGAPNTWMMRPPDAELLGPVGYRVTRRFEYDPATWLRYFYYRDKQGHQITDNSVYVNQARAQTDGTGNGVYIIRPKPLAFASLNLPKVFG